MHLDEFFEPKIHIVSGKGGVGKTTVSAALAVAAARRGRRVCIAEVDQKGTLPKLFGGEDLGYDPHELAPDVWGLNIAPEQALAEYLKVQYHMRLNWVFSSTHFVDYITTAAPGLKDILVLGKIWYLEKGQGVDLDFDTLIVDAPAAGHMVTFLNAPIGLADALRVGPVRRQAEWLVEMLRDRARSRVHLVTLAEEMPVSETVETAAALDERLGIDVGVVFANAVYSELLTTDESAEVERMVDQDAYSDLVAAGATVGLELDESDTDALIGYARFLEARRAIQSRYLRELNKRLDHPRVDLPYLFSAGLALPDVDTLADVIEEQVGKL